MARNGGSKGYPQYQLEVPEAIPSSSNQKTGSRPDQGQVHCIDDQWVLKKHKTLPQQPSSKRDQR